MTIDQSAFFRLSNEMMAALDLEGRILAANAAFATALGGSAHQLVGLSIFSLVREQAGKRLNDFMKQRQVGEPLAFYLDFHALDGTVKVMKSSLEFNATSQSYALICAMSVMMNEEEALRWSLALESTQAGFWSWDITSNVIFFSELLETMLGYERGELPLVFATLRDLTHPDEKDDYVLQTLPFIKGETSSFRFETRVRQKNGEYRWIFAMGARATDPQGRVLANGWHFDIQSQKEIEERLRRSEDRSRLLLQSIPDIFFVFDRNGQYLEVQTAAPEKLVHPAEKMIGHYIPEFLPAEIANLCIANIRRVIDEQAPLIFNYDIDVQWGHSFFEARVFPSAGETAVAIIRDVTAQSVAQAEVKVGKDRWQAFIQTCPATIFNFRVTPEGKGSYTYVAGRVEEMFEATAQSLIGTAVDDRVPPMIHGDDLPGAFAMLKTSAETMESYNWLGRFILKSGKIKWINTIATPKAEPNGSIVWSAIALDVTHERELAQKVKEQEALMSSSSRLAALGEMAGGIAHEINNPLTIAHAHASRLRDIVEAGKALDPTMVIRSTQKIEEVCMRISRIIAGLRSIARDGDNDRFTLVPLRPILEDALTLSTEKFRHKQIELIVDQLPDSISIECRSVQISQILVNLLLNSQHAVEDLPAARWIRLSVNETVENVEIRVSDSGPGIPSEIVEQIFDPFFTTKEVGKGTGLGLSVSASIAETHGGTLFLDLGETRTTFVLILPKRQAPRPN